MALWKRASKYYVEFTAPDGTRVRRSTGTSDRRKAEEYHDRLKAELWEASRLKKKPKRTWDEAALRWLKEKAQKQSRRDAVPRRSEERRVGIEGIRTGTIRGAPSH